MENRIIKLNIGCGPSGIDDWLNYDWGILPLLSKLRLIRKILVIIRLIPQKYNIKWPHLRLVDIRRHFPLKAEAVSFIYCSHVLEHFNYEEAVLILKECLRVLKNDGVLRIIVPDIQKMYELYQKNILSKSLNKDNSRPGRDYCRLWWGFNKDENQRSIIQFLSKRFIRDHQWHYDRDELKLILKVSGFEKIKFVNFREGNFPDLDPLDLESHKNHSLYAEVTK